MENRLKLEKIRLIVTIVIFLYFCLILLAYYFKLEYQFIMVIGQLLTIPALLGLVFIPIWAFIDSLRKKNDNQSIYILTLFISLITMAMLLIANSYSS